MSVAPIIALFILQSNSKLPQQQSDLQILGEQETMETKKMGNFPLLDVSVEVKSGNPDYSY